MMLLQGYIGNLFSYFFSVLGLSAIAFVVVKPILLIYQEYIDGKIFAKPLISIYLCDANSSSILTDPILSLIALAMASSIALSILIYLAGVTLRSQKLTVFMKTEFIDLLVTYGAVVVGLALLYLPCNLNFISFVDGDSRVEMNAYETAFFFLQYTEMYSFFSIVYSVIIGMLTFIFLGVFISNNIFGGLALPVFSGLSLIIKPMISNSVVAQTLAYVVYSLQIILYEFVTYGSVKYILPIGIVMRAFTPLKKVGGILIGFSIGTTLFYTLVLVFSWYVASPYMQYLDFQLNSEQPTYFDVSVRINLGGDKSYYKTIFSSVDKLEDLEKAAEEANKEYVERDNTGSFYLKYALDWIKSFFTPVWAYGVDIVKGVFRWFVVACGGFIIILIVLPILNLLIVITGVRFFSRFFGMDLDVSNLTKIV